MQQNIIQENISWILRNDWILERFRFKPRCWKLDNFSALNDEVEIEKDWLTFATKTPITDVASSGAEDPAEVYFSLQNTRQSVQKCVKF